MARLGNALFVAALLVAVAPLGAADWYLDDSLERSCDAYRVAERDCAGKPGSLVAWNGLDDYTVCDGCGAGATRKDIGPGDRLILRPGSYWMSEGVFNCTNQRDHPSCGLIAPGPGTAQAPIVLTTLAGEERQATLCNHPDRCDGYAPDPAECGRGRDLAMVCQGGENDGNSCRRHRDCPGEEAFCGNQGCRYYRSQSLSVWEEHVEVRNVKTYGQVCVRAKHALIADSDLGGAGPSYCTRADNQGQVVAMFGTDATTVLRNNRIHHSTKGDGSGNGACVMGYDFNARIEQNSFEDCYNAAIRLKDQSGHAGAETVVARNFFGRNRLGSGDQIGFMGCTQDCEIGRHVLTHNVFAGIGDRAAAIWWDSVGAAPPLLIGNTFAGNTGPDVGYWSPRSDSLEAYNNLHYSKRSQMAWDFRSEGGNLDPARYTADFNCYAGSHGWRIGRVWGKFKGWQKSGFDVHGVEIDDPAFVRFGCLESGDCTAADFKRTSYAENLEDSPHGNRCGAFASGEESIGVDW